MIPNAWAGFDFGLGSEVDMLRQSVNSFAQDRIAPRAAAIDRDNVFPRDLWPEMGALGLHGITVEEEYGGAGMATLRIALRWRRSAAAPPRSASPTERIRTYASTRSGATGPRRKSASICRS
jgi:isovaleryl-CoA dehydrogenase